MITRLISTLKGILIGAVVLRSLKNNYLLSPPTLQVEPQIGGPTFSDPSGGLGM